MHKHFREILTAAAAAKGQSESEFLKDFEKTLERAARTHLNGHKDESFKATVDPVTHEIKIHRNGKALNLDDLGRVHRGDDDLSAR